MNIRDRIRRLFRLRFAILYPLAVIVGVCAHVTGASILSGLWLMVPGVGLRLWSNSYAVKTEKLTTCGPYAFVRNPLYLGTLLILSGVVLMVQMYWVGIAALAAFTFAYARTVKNEETLLEDMYRQDYRDYKQAVPSFIPRLTPYAKSVAWPFSGERLRRSKEHKVVIWLGVGIILLHVKELCWVEKVRPDLRVAVLIAVAAGLALLDLFEEWSKKRNG
jgi:protein-S-isoprenylcysteine O-methyltransferase Ste14